MHIKFSSSMWSIFLMLVWLDLSEAEVTSSRIPETYCQWTPNAIQCKDNELDLSSVGCNSDQEFIIQTLESTNENVTPSLSCQSQKQTSCQECQTFGEWSKWSECCENTTCNIEMVGKIGRRREVRYRNLSTECLSKFSIDRSCTFDKELRLCGNNSRAAPPPGSPGDNSNEDKSSEGGLSSFVKIVLFAVAGVGMIALFGFAGVRLVRTMYLQPVGAQSNLPPDNHSNCANSQYSNASFREGTELMYTTETDPRSLQPINHQRGHRMMPPVTRLSIIQEEEDTLSASNPEMDTISERDLLNSQMKNGKVMDGSNALEYMDDILTQIEDDERAIRMEDPNYRCSIVKEESLKLLNKLGWNPSVRRTRSTAPDESGKPRSFESVEKLEASALSLASASLLEKNRASQSTTSSENTSSLAGSESCYSLKDISDIEASPNTSWPRQYSSEPDLSRMKHMIPDIEDMLSDSDSNVFVEDPKV